MLYGLQQQRECEAARVEHGVRQARSSLLAGAVLHLIREGKLVELVLHGRTTGACCASIDALRARIVKMV